MEGFYRETLSLEEWENSPPLEGWQKFKKFLTGWFKKQNQTIFKISNPKLKTLRLKPDESKFSATYRNSITFSRK